MRARVVAQLFYNQKLLTVSNGQQTLEDFEKKRLVVVVVVILVIVTAFIKKKENK